MNEDGEEAGGDEEIQDKGREAEQFGLRFGNDFI